MSNVNQSRVATLQSKVNKCEPNINRLIGKDSDAGRDWGQEKKGTTEDEMAGWHH